MARAKSVARVRPLQVFLCCFALLYVFAIVRFIMPGQLPAILQGVGLILAVAAGSSRHHLIVNIVKGDKQRRYQTWLEIIPVLVVLANYLINVSYVLLDHELRRSAILGTNFSFDFQGLISPVFLVAFIIVWDLLLIIDQYSAVRRASKEWSVVKVITIVNHLISAGVFLRFVMVYVIVNSIIELQVASILSMAILHLIVIWLLLIESLGQMKFLLPKMKVIEGNEKEAWEDFLELLETSSAIHEKPLSMSMVSEMIGTNEKSLRLAIRSHSGIGFPAIVNMFRFMHFLRQARLEGHKYTIEAMAMNSGFASRKTMYSFCRDHIGMPPLDAVEDSSIDDDYLKGTILELRTKN